MLRLNILRIFLVACFLIKVVSLNPNSFDNASLDTIGTASAKFRGISPRMYIEERIYFDNVGDNVTLTLYIVTLALVKPCLHNSKCDCSKTNGLNEVNVFFNKISL